MKKILLLILILIVLYGLSVFAMPQVSSTIDNAVGMPWFSEKLRWGKDTFDNTVTDIPSLNEFKSWALDAQKKFLDGVDSTKDTIDTVRGWAQKVEDTYNWAKETYDQAKNTLDEAKQTFEDLSGKVQEVQGVVESVQELTGGSE